MKKISNISSLLATLLQIYICLNVNVQRVHSLLSPSVLVSSTSTLTCNDQIKLLCSLSRHRRASIAVAPQNKVSIQNHHSRFSYNSKGRALYATSAATAVIMSSSNNAAATSTSSAIIPQIKTILTALSKVKNGANALNVVKDILLQTSPTIYFTCLVLAGAGVPISEDALCIFVGTILPTIWYINPLLRIKIISALYFGIVFSDIITFSIGRLMGNGLLEPIRKLMNVQMERVEFCDIGDDEEEGNDLISDEELMSTQVSLNDDDEQMDEFCEIRTDELQAKDNVLAYLENSGNYAGLVIRLSVGMRLPMMLAAGFSGKVPMKRFIIGTSIGAIFSLSIQLLLGMVMRNNPAMIIATIAGISATPLVIPSIFAFLSWVKLMYNRWTISKAQTIK